MLIDELSDQRRRDNVDPPLCSRARLSAEGRPTSAAPAAHRYRPETPPPRPARRCRSGAARRPDSGPSLPGLSSHDLLADVSRTRTCLDRQKLAGPLEVRRTDQRAADLERQLVEFHVLFQVQRRKRPNPALLVVAKQRCSDRRPARRRSAGLAPGHRRGRPASCRRPGRFETPPQEWDLPRPARSGSASSDSRQRATQVVPASSLLTCESRARGRRRVGSAARICSDCSGVGHANSKIME